MKKQMKREIISILKNEDSLISTIEKTLKNLKIDLRIDLKDYEKIIIKPNLGCYLHPSTGATTDVRFVEALIQMIRMENPNIPIYIVESDSGDGKKIEIAYGLLGYKELENKNPNVNLVNLTKVKKVKINFKGAFFNGFDYPELFQGRVFFLSVPKLKTLFLDYITCALKNQYGCNPFPDKWVYHDYLPEVIYDMNKLFTPKLILVDGLIAMEGYGPNDGIPKKMNLVIGGTAPASVDVIAAKIMRIQYNKVRYLKFILKKGDLGTDDIKIIGQNVDEIIEKFELPNKSILKLFA